MINLVDLLRRHSFPKRPVRLLVRFETHTAFVGQAMILSDIVDALNFAAETVPELMKSFLVIGSLLLSLTAGVAGSVVGVLLLWLVWEVFDLCTFFGGPMEGSCGYAFTFFLLPITVLVCFVVVTIFAFCKVYPWLVRRRATPR